MTRLFDYIHHKGCNAMDRRAREADAEYAKREDARKTTGGTIAVSAGPGGMQGYFDDLELRRKYRPWWHTVTLHIHWWLQKHGPSAVQNRRKWNKQRIKKGYSDRDLWGFQHFLSIVIRDGATELRDIAHGHPTDVTFEEWKQILTDIADGYQAAIDLSEINYDYMDLSAEAALQARYHKGSKLFVKHFFGMWD